MRLKTIFVLLIVLTIIVLLFVPLVRSRIEMNSLEYGQKAYKEKRYQDAVSFFHKAASYGSTEAQFMLGECFFYGYGVDSNPLEAYNWYRKAEKKNHNGARIRIVYYLIDPANLIMNKAEALEICEREAETGAVDAQYKVALLSEQVYAYKWFKRAAEQGHPDAQYRLGDCYENAKGIGKDLTQAYYWYKEAAAQGVKNAEQSMQRVKAAVAKEEKEIAKKRDIVRSSQSTRNYSERKTTPSSYSDPWDPLTWRQQEEIDEARYGYDKAPYKCRAVE